MGFCGQFGCFLFLLSLVTASVQLDCSIANRTINGSDGDFVLDLYSNETDPKLCQYHITMTMFRRATVTVSDATLTGSNSITIFQYPDWANATELKIGSESNGKKYTEIRMKPLDFFITFDLSNNTNNDQFEIMVAFETTDPSQSITVSSSNFGAIIDSQDIPANTIVNHAGGALKLAVFNDSIDHEALQNVFVYSENVYKGSLDDVLTTNKSKDLDGSQLKLFNTNSFSVTGYSVVVSLEMWNGNDWFPLKPLKKGSTAETLSAPGANGILIYHELTDPNMDPAITTNFERINFTGNGSMDVFSGCTAKFDVSFRVASINATNFKNFEFLSVSGRCRTYFLRSGTISWQKVVESEGAMPNQLGGQGVVMSHRFPYPEVTDYTVTQKVRGPEDGYNISVRYDVLSSDKGIQVQIENTQFSVEVPLFSVSNQSFTVFGRSPQTVRFNVPKGSYGILMQYTVETSGAHCVLYFGALLLAIVLNFK